MKRTCAVSAMVLCLIVGLQREVVGDVQPGSVVVNGGFELVGDGDGMPEAWVLYTSRAGGCTLNTTLKRSGMKSVELQTGGQLNAHKCIYQVIPVGVRERYEFSAYVVNNPSAPLGGSAYGTLVIEWWDKNEKEIARVESKKWGRNLLSSEWLQFTVQGRVPPGAASAHFAVYLCDGSLNGAGSFLVDDVEIVRR